MNIRLVFASIAVAVVYVAAVALFGFQGFIAMSINFWRVALATAVLIIYVPTLSEIFREVPPPRRDYLLAGIVLTWLSAICFSVWNEAGRIFGVTTSIFVSPIAGAFSLFLVLGASFHLLAPGTASAKRSLVAIAVGVAVGVAVAFIAPLLR